MDYFSKRSGTFLLKCSLKVHKYETLPHFAGIFPPIVTLENFCGELEFSEYTSKTLVL